MRSLPDEKFYFNIRDDGFQNPFDAMMLYHGKFYALEYKISKNSTSIPLFELFRNREHELRYLECVERCGGVSYILVNVFIARKINTVYCFRPSEYKSLCSRVHPRKSVKLTDPILDHFIRMEKIDGGHEKIWNLNQLIV